MKVQIVKAFYFSPKEVETIEELYMHVDSAFDMQRIGEALYYGHSCVDGEDGTVYKLNTDENIDDEPAPKKTKATKKKAVSAYERNFEETPGVNVDLQV